jgi:hypothetical protein
VAEAGEVGPAMVHDGSVHGALDTVGNVGGAGNLQEMTAGTISHEFFLAGDDGKLWRTFLLRHSGQENASACVSFSTSTAVG